MQDDKTRVSPSGSAPGDHPRFPEVDSLRLSALNLALAAVYILLAMAGLELATVGREVSPIWPAIGAAYGALFIFGPALAPGVALGAFAANLANGSPPAVALGIAVGNTLAPLAGAMLSRRFVSRPQDLIRSVRGIWTMTLAGAYGGALISASGGVVVLVATGALGGGDFMRAWLTWWLGDALGVLMVAPVLLAWWHREPPARGWMRALELAIVAGCIIGLATLAFVDVDLGLPGYYLQLYLIIPFTVWLALRFPPVTVAMVNLALAAVVTRLIVAGHGMNIAAGLKLRLEFVHGFLAITGFSALMLAAAVSERRRAQAVLLENQARFKTLTQLTSDWYWEQDKNFRFIRLDGHGLVAGLDIKDLLGKTCWEVPCYDMSEDFWAGHRALLDAHQPFHERVLRWRGQNGVVRYFRTSGEPMYDELGTFIGYRGVGKDVTAEVQAREAVSVSEERLRTLVEAMPDPVVMKDAAGRWIVANDAALRLSGLEGAEWFGRTDEDITRIARSGLVSPLPCTCGDPGAYAQSDVSRCEKSAAGEDGIERVFDIVGKELRDSAGRAAGLVILGRDISHLKQAEQVRQRQFDEIRRLNDELESRVRARTAALEASNRELEAFSYSVSHDLRSPLRALDGFSRMLEEDYEDRLGPEGVDYLRRIRRASQRMGRLIDDLLDLSRISRSEVKRVPVDLSAGAEEVAKELGEAEPGRRVEWVIAPALSAWADAGLIQGVLENLLRNAWKFTRESTAPRIEFGREEREGEGVFFVRDNGVGFDMGHAVRLFSPFQRLHGSERFEGSGIGLAIVQRIVRLHGGEVWAESVPGRGATFYFTLG